MVFIWLELVASTIIGGIAWGYVRLFIPPSLWFFTGMSMLFTLAPFFEAWLLAAMSCLGVYIEAATDSP